MKTFRINKDYQIVCEYQKTRNGFKHTAKLKQMTFFNTVSETKVCYLNRTWENFEYETVIEKLLSFNTDIIPKGTQTKFLNKCKGIEHKKVNDQFKTVSMVAQIGNILCNDQKETNDWKKRMLLAGLPGLSIPDDWNELNENEKTIRLDNVINELKK